MWKSLSNIDTKPFQVFAETQGMDQVPTELIESSKALVVRASGRKETDSLASLRTQNFLAGKSGLLLNLPPTDDALEQHIKRAALATIITKSFQHQRTLIIDFASFGWILQDEGKVNPIMVTRKALPPNLETVVRCKCKKRCAGNCACSKNNVPYYIGCSCQGKPSTCTRAAYVEENPTDD